VSLDSGKCKFYISVFLVFQHLQLTGKLTLYIYSLGRCGVGFGVKQAVPAVEYKVGGNIEQYEIPDRAGKVIWRGDTPCFVDEVNLNGFSGLFLALFRAAIRLYFHRRFARNL
jgi:hypothetical protein